MDFPINRLLSRRITPWLARLGLTPNQVTLLSLGSGLLAAYAFSRGTPRGWLLGAFWFQLAYLLDNCDGELARMTGASSGFGSWFDLATDCLIHMAFFFGLGLGLQRVGPNSLWSKLGIVAAGGVLLTYVTAILEQVQRRGQSAWIHPDPPVEEGYKSFWEKVRKVLREDFSFAVWVGAFLGRMGWLLWGGVLGSHLYWMMTASAILNEGGSWPWIFNKKRERVQS